MVGLRRKLAKAKEGPLLAGDRRATTWPLNPSEKNIYICLEKKRKERTLKMLLQLFEDCCQRDE